MSGMDIRIIRLADAPTQPWKNGGGATRELLRWPAQGDWQWRISVARIDRDGPFSHYDGVGRWFAVLRGAGVALRFADRTVECRDGDAPLRFDGGDPPYGRLLGGPSHDLNLMFRPAQAAASMRRHDLPCSIGPRAAHWRAVYAIDAAGLVAFGRRIALPADSLAWLPPAEDAQLELHAVHHTMRKGNMIVIEIPA